ncbi:MAG TPA: phosphoribosylaminoimidazolesuccinocarboxamide synthase [bacterium]|nr:phosphoribosylaminoimidazolesuccinocarboxamide synthase [bacterium]HNT64558.1 phosphoribosylaminoimidazolesuccinocarboxamide synthase [bacterium]HOX84599.1 phosphoribosylaminoimidazolesuccinocarboxamide synthase [bacterium]HPG45322.1 phosphoribosylaminoimidazolesuccinocarboxamide synthase [bacterium]HPM98959.1 phosphoribosylaminoimidazolesuccinocarboxamide synthase [bacterium]
MKTKKISEDNGKKIYETENETQLIQVFKDDLIIKNGNKISVPNKGAINNAISSYLFRILDSYHIPNHFLKQLSNREMLVRKLHMIPISVFVHNIAAGRLVKFFAIHEGKELDCPIIEYHLKGGEKEDTMVNEDHIISFGHASSEELKEIHRLSSKVNAILKEIVRRRGFRLVNLKLEYGRRDTQILLGDEISADTCSLWDLQGNSKFDSRMASKSVDQIADEYQSIKKRFFMES